MLLTRVFRTWSTYVILAALYLFFVFTISTYGGVDNLRNILVQLVPVVIAASAITFVMVAGSLDLSVGGSIGLSGVIAAQVSASGGPILLAMIGGVLVGAIVGLVNGVLVVTLDINPVIATLGTWYVSQGVASLLSGGSSITVTDSEFARLGTGQLGWLPYSVIVMIAVVAVAIFLERFTLLGKYTVAMGSNFEGARLSGIRVNRLRIGLFVLAGLTAGIAGIVVASRLDSGQPTLTTQGWEFQVIVAAVLGGVSLAGGRGTVLGTCAGAAIVVVISVALNQKGINPFWQLIVQGVLLVGVVAIDAIFKGGRARPVWLTGLRGLPKAKRPADGADINAGRVDATVADEGR